MLHINSPQNHFRNSKMKHRYGSFYECTCISLFASKFILCFPTLLVSLCCKKCISVVHILLNLLMRDNIFCRNKCCTKCLVQEILILPRNVNQDQKNLTLTTQNVRRWWYPGRIQNSYPKPKATDWRPLQGWFSAQETFKLNCISPRCPATPPLVKNCMNLNTQQ